MSNQKTTCGPLYRQAREVLVPNTTTDDAERRAFAKGMMVGQAEKVILGAALGCMFRSNDESFEWMYEALNKVADVYGLYPRVYRYPKRIELWLLRNRSVFGTYSQMRDTEVNSPLWHTLRAHLCGIPVSEIDFKFHERYGSPENPDGPEA